MEWRQKTSATSSSSTTTASSYPGPSHFVILIHSACQIPEHIEDIPFRTTTLPNNHPNCTQHHHRHHYILYPLSNPSSFRRCLCRRRPCRFFSTSALALILRCCGLDNALVFIRMMKSPGPHGLHKLTATVSHLYSFIRPAPLHTISICLCYILCVWFGHRCVWYGHTEATSRSNHFRKPYRVRSRRDHPGVYSTFVQIVDIAGLMAQ